MKDVIISERNPGCIFEKLLNQLVSCAPLLRKTSVSKRTSWSPKPLQMFSFPIRRKPGNNYEEDCVC
jgi:hypothetical protein